jgi:hypothetical protein
MFLRRTQKEIAGGRRKAVYWFVAEKQNESSDLDV